MNDQTIIDNATARADRLNAPIFVFRAVRMNGTGGFPLYQVAIHFEHDGQPNPACEAAEDAQFDADFLAACASDSFAPVTVLPRDYFI